VSCFVYNDMTRLLIILILITIPLLSHGQLLQAVAGVSATRAAGFSGDESISGNILAGYTLGLTGDIPLKQGSCCAIRTELFLNRWGSRFATGTAGRTNATRSLGLSYIQSPVLFVDRIGLSLTKSLLVGAGPYAAWRINAPSQLFKVDRVNNHAYGALYPDDGLKEDYYRRLDYGFSFQCSLEIYNRVNLCLRYDCGLRNILEQGSGTVLYNRALTLSLGYYLNMGRFLSRRFPLAKSTVNK